MPTPPFIHNKHLLWRAGFGVETARFDHLHITDTSELLEELLYEEDFAAIGYHTFVKETINSMDYASPAEKKKAMQQRYRKQNEELNLNFLDRMVNSREQLREKMAFFWHGHFAARVQNPEFNGQLLNVIRKNALGNFKDLLYGVSRSPAMLNFLNNQQNKKDHPNENFAREVMELFTMGRGSYTEKDIREAARAFTGWGYDKNGRFTEREMLHDKGTKTFLGKTGNFTGSDVLDIILGQKATARFITAKICRFFVNENADGPTVDALSEKFYASGYNIKSLMKDIFSSSWFYSQKNIGTRIKSPIELMAGMMRALPMEIRNPENLMVYQKLLGQMLLYPPNVAGWPGGKSWIDSSTLMLRLQLPQIWSGLRPLDYRPKDDDDLTMGLKTRSADPAGKGFKNPNIIIDWEHVEKVLAGKNIGDYLLQSSTLPDINSVKNFSDGSVKMNIINLMCTPEYQLM